ncbi:hypothetical protein HJG53_03970 [Sphingomonas sp. ID1715]|uniref:hypothetical protein n=1 Tax=Sphingomonas sp. ID1715 TaxID=1656898 RepID=UPI0014889D14|nr:hypothetical protein [Sphingomonas sp. ID1715]NNM76064.1 hypothetical protein [Sphingomonas sp. ID1715]
MMNESIEAAKVQREDLSRAEAITVADFSTALSGGILRAIEARKRPGAGGVIDWRPWIWAGWIIGDGPFGPGGGPFDPGTIKDQQPF